jgi:hypothetical protein
MRLFPERQWLHLLTKPAPKPTLVADGIRALMVPLGQLGHGARAGVHLVAGRTVNTDPLSNLIVYLAERVNKHTSRRWLRAGTSECRFLTRLGNNKVAGSETHHLLEWYAPHYCSTCQIPHFMEEVCHVL